MKHVRDEKGYTLALTLILVMIIFIFTASLTVASMNQSKQVVKTDQSFVATSLAEMGAERTDDTLSQIIQFEQNNYHTCYLASSTAAQETACFNQSLQSIKTQIDNHARTTEVDGPENVYTVSNVLANGNPNQFYIKVTGISHSVTKQIDLYYKIDPEVLTKYVYNDTSQAPITETSTTLIDQDILDCIDDLVCKNKLIENGFVIHGTEFDGSNNNFDPIPGTTYIFQEGAIFGQLKATGNNQLGTVQSVNIYTPEEFTLDFTKFLSVKGSNIEGGDIVISHNGAAAHNMFEDTTLIANSISITGNNVVIPFSDTRVCVKDGHLSSADNFLDYMTSDEEVNIYFKIANDGTESHIRHTWERKVKGNWITYTGGYVHYVKEDNYISSCGVSSFTFPDTVIDPKPPIEEINYN